MLIDDNKEILYFTGQYIKHMGYEPIVHTDWLVAFEDYKTIQHTVALVIVDIVLGGSINGETLSDMIRAINPFQPILHISGYVRPDDMRIDHFLMKPYQFDDFEYAAKKAISDIGYNERPKGEY